MVHAGVPQIVLEFDVTNSYLLTAQITYNRREANNKILAFNSRDLQQRLIDEFNDMKIWDAAGLFQRPAVPSLGANASFPGMTAVGGFFRDFECIRTASGRVGESAVAATASARGRMRVYASRECTEAVSRLYMFHTGEDHSAMALAIDRRRALEDEEEAEEAEE